MNASFSVQSSVLSSEWTKLRSLRSTWLMAVVTVLFGMGVGALIASGQARGYASLTEAERAAWDPTAASLLSLLLAQLVIGMLGVLVITGEYATGTIQPSLVAVPRRGRLFAGKAVVLAAVVVAVGQLTAFASFFLGQATIAATDAPHATLDQPGVLRAVVGCGLYLAALGLLGFGLGTIVRSTAGGIGLLVGITLVVRLLSQALPADWAEWMDRYWPTAAGERIAAVVPVPGALAPWAGFGLLCACVAAVCAAGYAVLRTRDA